MTNSSYGGKKRWQNLKEAVESFIDSTAENSPTSKIAIVTFDKDSTERDILADFTTVGDGSNLHSAMDPVLHRKRHAAGSWSGKC